MFLRFPPRPSHPTGCTLFDPFRGLAIGAHHNEELILPAELTTTPKAREYNDFYQPLVSALQESGFLDRDKQYFGTAAGRIIPSHFDQRAGYASYFSNKGDYVWALVNFQSDDRDVSNKLFERLHLRRELVEASIELDPAAE